MSSRAAAMASTVALVMTLGHNLMSAEQQPFIVKCPRPCVAVLGVVAALGGEVRQVYENVDAVAVTVPSGRVTDLTVAAGPGTVRKDTTVKRPPLEAIPAGSPQTVGVLGDADALADFVRDAPENYNYNNNMTKASTLHAAGVLGQHTIVALIDTGVQAVSPTLTTTVIGGENLVPLTVDPVASATSRLNDWHGTAVADMIAAHAAFGFVTRSTFVQSLLVHSPQSAINCPSTLFPDCPPGLSAVPMIGTAPAASIYALKVFPAQGGGTPESRVIAAMDRAITLRRNFNDGVPSTPVAGSGSENDPFRFNSLNIQVVNMSFGGPTLFAGRDIQDRLTVAMLEVGITLATSAGNDGFAAMTGGSPGTGIGSLTVGASSTPAHERILRDIQFGLGLGVRYRPSNDVQTAYFSSRGPTADGRFDPNLSANGFASYVSAFAAVTASGNVVSCGAAGVPAAACVPLILFVTGTSFASPTVAGGAALLRSAVPDATAIQVRSALVRGADPSIVKDGSSRIDQGAGFADFAASLALLAAGDVKSRLTVSERADDRDDDRDDLGEGGQSVTANVRRLGFDTVRFVDDRFSTKVTQLKPGQVAQFFVPSDERTDKLIVAITDVVHEGPQNVLFGDDLVVMGVDAPTSFAVHRIEDPPGSQGVLVTTDRTFTIDNPQTGLVRIALQGDSTNGGWISARLTIERIRSPFGRPAARGTIKQDDLIPFSITVPAGIRQAVVELFWRQNWGRYPTNDLDLLVVDPHGRLVLNADGSPVGATLDSPERVVLDHPAPGVWMLFVNGFLIHPHGRRHGHDDKDVYTLKVTADGEPLPPSR